MAPQSVVGRRATAKSTSRKRKNEDDHSGSARSTRATRAREVEAEAEAEAEAGSDSDLSSLDSGELLRPALLERPVTPLNLDDIAAPPASSGSEDEGDIWPDIHALAKRRRRGPALTTPVRADQLSDISSPPSLTHSPNFADVRGTRGRTDARRAASPKLTTADLARMLPKRHYKKARNAPDSGSEEEVDNSGLGQDEDELSHLDTRGARRRTASRGARASDSALQPRQIPASTRSSSRTTRAQARQVSNKENESESEEDEGEQSAFQALPDDTFDAGSENATEKLDAEELKQAAKKFVEVDKWALDFEEAIEPSSPQDGR